MGCEEQGHTQWKEVADLTSSWRGINVPDPLQTWLWAHRFSTPRICHYAVKKKICINNSDRSSTLDWFYMAAPCIPYIDIIYTAVKLCIWAPFHSPFGRLPSFLLQLCAHLLVCPSFQGSHNLDCNKLNILWGFLLCGGNLRREQRHERLKNSYLRQSATWHSDVHGEQNIHQGRLWRALWRGQNKSYCIF